MKVRFSALLQDCIEKGVRRGWQRAHKYVEAPSDLVIFDNIEECIMGEIYEWFSFDDECTSGDCNA